MIIKQIKRLAHKLIPYDVECAIRRPVIKESVSPVLYNADGEQMHIAYLKARGSAHHPYMLCDGPMPKNILWDRFNYGLDVHFYSAHDVFHTKSTGAKHYARLAEAEVIIPDVYRMFRKHKEYIAKEFDAFFTHHAEFLDTFKNARFCPAGAVWYGSPQWGGVIKADITKSKMVSIVSSNKAACELHVFRMKLAQHLINHPKVDVLGTIVGKYTQPVDIFKDYRYSIAVENEIYPYWFTEKITNCFASKTVPIYIGATDIGKYFNTDGIIIIKEFTIEAIEKALELCSEEDYVSRMDAINDNYNRVMDFLCPEDYICRHYKDVFEKR